ncbi:YozE family protein [Jannaschia helgolandensis]|uniref:YozE family protein n=1 Tax=Jannaschia helgolandensis TaxID=188906 RepID=UPI003C715F0A
MIGFREYVNKTQARSSPQRDFIEDARLDKDMPNANSWRELHSYLSRKNASQNAIDAAKIVWASYSNYIR